MEQEYSTDDQLESELEDGDLADIDEADDSDDSDYSLDDPIYSVADLASDKNLNNGDKIEWDQSLSVDIPEIDEIQKRVFAMLNGLINHKYDDDEIIKDSASMVSELIEYSRYYFGKEEEYLRKSGYPDIECHSKEHRQFIKNAISLRRLVSEDKNNLSYQNITNLRDWLVSHISQKDHVYVPFIRLNNYVEECRLRR
ncbi:MAG: hemerythrin family protein [Desulfamplus sp.]|nr:hemerythrin family protein [Desulfamplus sp.]MBF0390583.1 hemerythrin family protein [Desulfamplus sp.]